MHCCFQGQEILKRQAADPVHKGESDKKGERLDMNDTLNNNNSNPKTGDRNPYAHRYSRKWNCQATRG
jgi:hypothetical protein